MVLRVPDEEDVPCGLGFVVVHPAGQVVVSGLQAPLPHIDQGQWFSPNVEMRQYVLVTSLHVPLFLIKWSVLGKRRRRANALGRLLPAPSLEHLPELRARPGMGDWLVNRTDKRGPCATYVLVRRLIMAVTEETAPRRGSCGRAARTTVLKGTSRQSGTVLSNSIGHVTT